MNYIGIDPGASGGIAQLEHGILKTFKMPENMMVLLNFLNDQPENTIVILERVGMYRNDKDTPGKAMRMVKLVENYGELKSVVKMSGKRIVFVEARSWQCYLKLWQKGEERAERKRRYRDYAASVFNEKITLNVADAVCLCLYGLRAEKNNPERLVVK